VNIKRPKKLTTEDNVQARKKGLERKDGTLSAGKWKRQGNKIAKERRK
jgi:hypothetical protein